MPYYNLLRGGVAVRGQPVSTGWPGKARVATPTKLPLTDYIAFHNYNKLQFDIYNKLQFDNHNKLQFDIYNKICSNSIHCSRFAMGGDFIFSLFTHN